MADSAFGFILSVSGFFSKLLNFKSVFISRWITSIPMRCKCHQELVGAFARPICGDDAVDVLYQLTPCKHDA